MREILFKAKRIDNGEWIIGNLVSSEDAEQGWETIIIPTFDSNMFTQGGEKEDLGVENWHRVDKSTVCQFTGLTDKNGNKIWENDIVQWEDFDADEFISVIRYDEENARFVFDDYGIECYLMEDEWYENPSVFEKIATKGFDDFYAFGFEVIGNVFDNPELLKTLGD